MLLPDFILTVLNMLDTSGFEAYVVGGCVRDTLLGITPSDWDVCTSALPNQIEAVFSSFKTIPTGIKHGTVTIIINSYHVEITTFRIDGEYSDNRRPSEVTFTPSLREDLSRRDFTVNAMAYNPSCGIVDLFGGQQDLKKKIIRCVGEPKKRFCEDALRIMRALRFAAVYGFDIETNTKTALKSCRNLLDNIAVERIAVELNKLVISPNPTKILRYYSDVFSQILPEITPAIGFKQNNPHHCYDVWEHTLSALENSVPKLYVRLALLFHDLAKPFCAEKNSENFVYFPNHPELGTEITAKALRRLKYDNKTRHTVKLLVKLHDSPLDADKVSIKRMLNKIGSDIFRMLLDVKLADNLAKAPDHKIHYFETLESEKLFNEIIASSECFSLKTLAVNGTDLLQAENFSGSDVGKALDYLLNLVIEGKCENEKKALLQAIKDI